MCRSSLDDARCRAPCARTVARGRGCGSVYCLGVARSSPLPRGGSAKLRRAPSVLLSNAREMRTRRESRRQQCITPRAAVHATRQGEGELDAGRDRHTQAAPRGRPIRKNPARSTAAMHRRHVVSGISYLACGARRMCGRPMAKLEPLDVHECHGPRQAQRSRRTAM